jgi:NAD+ kinase
MKVALVGMNLAGVQTLLSESGFEIVQKDPEVVVSWGGDGTLLEAERLFPGIPKLPLRRSDRHQKCPRHQDKKMIEGLLRGRLTEKRFRKLETLFKGGRRLALNEVTLSQALPTRAVRFYLWVGGQKLSDEPLVGDGVVVATTFGASGYFRSISQAVFTTGIGVALNNVVFPPLISGLPLTTMVVAAEAQVKVEVTRGPALLTGDNESDLVELGKGDGFTTRLSEEEAVIIGLEAFRCRDCYRPD